MRKRNHSKEKRRSKQTNTPSREKDEKKESYQREREKQAIVQDANKDSTTDFNFFLVAFISSEKLHVSGLRHCI